GHGYGYGGLRSSLAPDRAGRRWLVGPAAQWLRPWPAFLRRRRLLRKSPARGGSAQARAARQGNRADQDLGARSGHRPRRLGPFPQGTWHGLSRHLPDALPDRSGLDRAL